jgi:hypothetical protein
MPKVKIEVSNELFKRIEAAAAALGMSADDYASALINNVAPRASDQTERRQAATPAADDRKPRSA